MDWRGSVADRGLWQAQAGHKASCQRTRPGETGGQAAGGAVQPGTCPGERVESPQLHGFWHLSAHLWATDVPERLAGNQCVCPGPVVTNHRAGGSIGSDRAIRHTPEGGMGVSGVPAGHFK